MESMILAILMVGSLGVVAAAQAAGDAAAGQAKAAGCAMCHGPNGQGTSMAPELAGESPRMFIRAMNDYKSGKRDNAVMKAQADSLSESDIANLAAYYGSIK